MPTIARHLVITGRVQGVSYRDWAVRTARGLALTGWVRNRTDGSVEALAIGEATAVDAFAARCREGPAAAQVEDVRCEPAEVRPHDRFERRATADRPQ